MTTLFFSYSHKDEALRDRLEVHLGLLKHQGLIDVWHDRRIIAGDEVDDAIFNTLNTADIILLLVSADFVSSAYCYSREMKRAIERHEAGEARVIPVILHHCLWQTAPFGKLMAAPRDGKPVTAWADQNEALTDVANQIARAITALESSARTSSSTTKALKPSEKARTSQPKPRSSNLRLKKTFTDQDRDDYLRSTFDFICRFFEGSVEELASRNADVTGACDRVDSRRMSAVLYRTGKKIAECSVRLEGFAGGSDGIAFSHDASIGRGSFNEMLRVEADEQSLYLKPMGLITTGSDRNKHLSEEGAAEYLWGLIIDKAQ